MTKFRFAGAAIPSPLTLALGALALVALVAGPAARSADTGAIVIDNHFDRPVTFLVIMAVDYDNCMDRPLAGDFRMRVPAHGSSAPIAFTRKDGHGCNGDQGQFVMAPSLPGAGLSGQRFSTDSHAVLGFGQQGVGPAYLSQLVQLNGVYHWIVSPKP